MKLFIILCSLIAANHSQPIVKTWTLNELSAAMEKPNATAMHPYLVDALNQIMYALFTGNDEQVHTILPSPSGAKTWTLDELMMAIDGPRYSFVYQPFILKALTQLNHMQESGSTQNDVEVDVPALDISVWTISDVQEARTNPKTKTSLLPYLEKAMERIQQAIKDGQRLENINVTLVTPVGLIPLKEGTKPNVLPKSERF